MSVQPAPTTLPEVLLIQSVRHEDERGSFSEIWNRRNFAVAGVGREWVQDNEAVSRQGGTIRGIHYQLPPHAQAKLVRVVQGAILDVAVDLRRSSARFGEHVAVELREGDGQQLFVPEGFGHAYCTLEPDTIVLYRVSDYHAPASERGVRWDDPRIGARWPVAAAEAVVSGRDRALPRLGEQADLFA